MCKIHYMYMEIGQGNAAVMHSLKHIPCRAQHTYVNELE